jgi:hypothetical protein
MAETTTQEAPPEAPPATQSEASPPDSITWTASEFIAHEKSPGWYLMLAAATLIIAVLIYLITRDYISVGVVVVAGLLLGTYGARQPRQLQYTIDRHGVTIGPKAYNYNEFRSFAVIQEGAFSSITFMPLKRFSPPISIYYAPEDEEKIVALLSDKLPFEQRRLDAVDNLMRKIRF